MFARNLIRTAIVASTSLYTLSYCDRITDAIDNFKNFKNFDRSANPLFKELHIEESYIKGIDHRYNYGIIKYCVCGDKSGIKKQILILYIRNMQDLINAILLNSRNNKLIACYDNSLYDIEYELDKLCTIYGINKSDINNKLRFISATDLEKLYKIECIKRE